MPALTFDDLPTTTPGGVAIGPNGRPRVEINTSPKSNVLSFDDLPEASTGAEIGRYAKDIGSSIISGLDKGVAGLVGAPADIGRFVQDQVIARGQSYVQGRPLEDVRRENDANAFISPETLAQWGGKAIHEASGLAHSPQTNVGRYAETAFEFVPSAILGPGSMARNAVALGIVPGLASEGAGQLAGATLGPSAEPWARAGAAVLGGGVGHWATAPNAAQAAVSRAARGATQAQVDEAGRLFDFAQSAGIPITQAEALQHVTGGATNLGNLQRVVEGSGELRPFMAARPGQVQAAAAREFDALGPQSANPSNIGPRVGQAAEGIVQDATGAINRASRPYYQAAETQRVGPQVQAALAGDPLYARTLQEVRNDPALNRTIAHLPDDSVGVVDLVQRRLREQADNAAIPGQASTSNLAAANYADARTAPIAAADAVTGSRPGVAGSYETARDIQAQLRQQYLEPLLSGPIGKIAGRDTTTQKAINALFPTNPLPNSQREITTAVSALANRNPMAARELVRAHVEGTFNEAVQRLQSGANEFGGAGFAAVLRGNPQQAANLEAAVTALRGGQTWQGFDRFLTVLEAQGSRQRIGSQTAFNQEVQRNLKQGGTAAEALSAAATGGIKAPAMIKQRLEEWRLGRNVGEIAQILTDPRAAPLFRQLATAPETSARASAIMTRLVYLGTEDSRLK